MKGLNINLGSDQQPRFSCDCHKLNCAVRKSIKQHKHFSSILKKLNSSNAHFKRSIALNKIFKEKKCRLRLINDIRWSSQFLMLESCLRAYNNGAFDTDDEQIKCPVSMAVIETYVRILKPAYLFSINMQYNNSTMMDIIPGVLNLLNAWMEMKDSLSEIPKKYCSLIIECTENKFKYELNSQIYLVRFFIKKYL